MSQLVRAAAQAYGDAPAIALRTEGGEDDVESFVGLERRSAELARALLARGMGKGSRVGFLFGNGPTFAVTIAAITRIGAIAVPVSTMIRANELVRVLRQSDVAGLIVQRNLLGHDIAQRLLEALPDLVSAEAGRIVLEQVPYLRWVVSTGDDLPPAVETMESLLAGAPKVSDGVLRAVEAEVYPTDQMIEIYTSGSMALPKGVKHNHGPVLFRSRYLWNLQGFETGRQVDALLPFFWVGGLMMYLMPNWSGGGLTVCAERTLHNSRIALGTVMTDEDLESDRLPPRLKPWRRKLFGLTIDPERLQQIRQERRPDSRYARLETCRREVQVAEAMFALERIPTLSTTHTSIEEISSKVLSTLGLQREMF